MRQENYNDLYAFLTVAQSGGFTKGAGKLGISQSALSRTIKLLENRLGVQLFTRTTRSLSLTEAGNRLYQTVSTSFGKIDHELTMLDHYRNTPSGLVRITVALDVIERILLPKLTHFAQDYPEIRLELVSENRFVDIVAEGFDAGVRFGSDVGEGMIAVRISPDVKMAVVASPNYFEQHGFPENLAELEQHNCLEFRLASGEMYRWEFQEQGKVVKIKPQGQWVFNHDHSCHTAALAGLGIAYLPEYLVADDLEKGRLVRIFTPQSRVYPGFHLYYPHRNVSPALRVVIDSLRW